MNMSVTLDPQPVVQRLVDFDRHSGNRLERAIFNHRSLVLLLCLVVSVLLGWQAMDIRLNASFEKTIPGGHPFIVNFLENRASLSGAGNAIRIAVETDEENIYSREYLDILAKINDEVYLIPGVDRPYMKSLWTPTTRWMAVTEDGLDGGTVIPESYDGSPASLNQIRANLQRSGEIGQLVASDFKSSNLYIPLLDIDPQTGQALDYGKLSKQLETIRGKYQSQHLKIHITGFAKIVGDLIEGLQQVLLFFLVAIVIASAMLYAYTHCLRSTLLVVGCSLIAVLWQFGLVASLGFELDPYSVLVPFLIFAIGISHAAQKMNGIMQDIGRGTHRVIAARYTFRRLFAAGITALLCDAVGFAVLAIIDIQSIRELALIASIGVAVLIFTNLILLPVLLSFTGVDARAAARSHAQQERDLSGAQHRGWKLLTRFTHQRWAVGAVLLSLMMATGGYIISQNLKIGDLDPGAPELRAESRYNHDNAFMVEHYAASSDIFVVMIKTGADACTRYRTLSKVDELAWQLEQLPGVEATNSMASLSRLAAVGYNEGNLKWLELIPNDAALGGVQSRAPREFFNQNCSLLSLYIYLSDHKAGTLERVVQTVQDFKANNDSEHETFLLAAGSAGIEAATNAVVKQAMHEMLYWVYGAVIMLCAIVFRSWRAVVAAVLPLVFTSILCEALMVLLGMGVKVATLPVIALGVGIGVDYALYVLSVMLVNKKQGMSLEQSYHRALLFTGRVVLLTGFTLAVAVATWAFSPIKFQADMGVLLAFMFLWNMLGALVLLPALARLLLPASYEARHPPNATADV